MKKLLFSLVLLVALGGVAFATGGKLTLTGPRDGDVASVMGTIAASRVDTVLWTRDASVSAATFAIHAKDSMSVDAIIIRRIVDGALQPLAAGDTLASSQTFTVNNAATSTVFANGSSKTYTVTLNPLADQYAFIIVQASSGNGTTVTTCRYELIKQFSRR